METLEFFQRLTGHTCAFCGHDVREKTVSAYTNVCMDCLDVLDEE